MKRTREIIREAVPIAVFLLSCLAILLCAAALSGCSPRVEYVPVEKVRTEYRDADTTRFMALLRSLEERASRKESHEESLIHKEWDKETVTLDENGDTVGRDHDHGSYIHLSSKERSEYERIIKCQSDSIADLQRQLSSVKVDSVPVPYQVEKTVYRDRELTAWQKAKMDFGGGAMAALCILALAGAFVWFMKIKRRK